MTDAWGITEGYNDWAGQWVETTEATRSALRASFGLAGHEAPPEPPNLWVVSEGDAAHLWNPCDLELEDGSTLTGVRNLPPDLPLGYHWLQPLDGWPSTRLVVTPRRAPALPTRVWGWATQLYATRSERSWGIGDLADLRELARWTASLGGRVILTNPLHAPPPDAPKEPSPYFASSRLMVNPMMLAVEEIDGWADLADSLQGLATQARALNTTRRIDRMAVWAAKLPALEALFDWQEQRPALRDALDTWTARQHTPVVRWGAFCAVNEEFGRPWATWAPRYRDPFDPAVAEFSAGHGRRVRFHIWLQWQLDRQRAAAAGRGVDLIGDLAVGFEPDGFDAWLYQDHLAHGARVGAPPDGFNAAGQDWGLPPFIPWRLRAALYQPFIDTVRANLRHVGGLRMDHVMGLFRLYCIPPGHSAADGAYVRYPAGDLLDLLTLEATRAGAFVIGEDLGTVEDEVQSELADRNVAGCRVVWFTDGDEDEWPAATLGSVTTHDLPTVAGIWTGADGAARRRLGIADEDSQRSFLQRLQTRAPHADSVREVITAVHDRLARSGSSVVLASLDDALGLVEPPNVPGTIDEWPNWRIGLPVPLEVIQRDSAALELAHTMNVGRAAPVAAPVDEPTR